MLTTKLLATLAAATAIGSAASPSWSAPDPDRITVRVPVADLNLSTESGATAALRRIHAAAQGICGAQPDSRQLGRSALYSACVNQTVGVAVASANQPMLAAVAERRMRPTLLAAR
jgi:UrcA family protein